MNAFTALGHEVAYSSIDPSLTRGVEPPRGGLRCPIAPRRTCRWGWPGRSAWHRKHDGVAAEAQHESRRLRLEAHDHTRLVLHPEFAGARRADRKAVARLAIRAWKLGDLPLVVHLAFVLDRREPDAANTCRADLERMLGTGIVVRIDPGIVRAGRLHLVEAVVDRIGVELVAEMPRG